MVGEIISGGTSTRYWSYRYAIGAPSLSVIVETSGGSVVTRSAEMLSTVSLARFDTMPSEPTTGNNMPASSTPASRHRPSSFSTPFLARMQVSVRGTQSGDRDRAQLITQDEYSYSRQVTGGQPRVGG